jgi:hypothetical protein
MIKVFDEHYVHWLLNGDVESLLQAVPSDGLRIRYVQDPSPDLCLVAVRQNWRALRYIPQNLQTSEMCCIALEQSPDARVMIKIEWTDDMIEEYTIATI